MATALLIGMAGALGGLALGLGVFVLSPAQALGCVSRMRPPKAVSQMGAFDHSQKGGKKKMV